MRFEEIQDMVNSGYAEFVTPGDVDPFVFYAQESLDAAKVLTDAGLTDQAVKLLWDAARNVLEGLLYVQGLRVKGNAHHSDLIRLAKASHLEAVKSRIDTIERLRRRRTSVTYVDPDADVVAPVTDAECDAFAGEIIFFVENIDQIADNLRVIR